MKLVDSCYKAVPGINSACVRMVWDGMGGGEEDDGLMMGIVDRMSLLHPLEPRSYSCSAPKRRPTELSTSDELSHPAGRKRHQLPQQQLALAEKKQNDSISSGIRSHDNGDHSQHSTARKEK